MTLDDIFRLKRKENWMCMELSAKLDLTNVNWNGKWKEEPKQVLPPSPSLDSKLTASNDLCLCFVFFLSLALLYYSQNFCISYHTLFLFESLAISLPINIAYFSNNWYFAPWTFVLPFSFICVYSHFWLIMIPSIFSFYLLSLIDFYSCCVCFN